MKEKHAKPASGSRKKTKEDAEPSEATEEEDKLHSRSKNIKKPKASGKKRTMKQDEVEENPDDPWKGKYCFIETVELIITGPGMKDNPVIGGT